MANKYFYSNTSVATTLASAVTAGGTSISVDSATGFPSSFPYILALDFEGTSEELVKITAGSGTSLTAERGFGGTSAQSHGLGAAVRHVVNAVDLTDFRTHEQDGTAVHGLTGDVVGTSDTQTLTNKTLTSPTVTAPDITGGGTLDGTFTGEPVFSEGLGMGGVAVNESASGFFSVGDTAFQSERASETSEAYTSLVTGDTFNRFEITAAGSMAWGDGASARDVMLYRQNENILGTDDIVRVSRPAADDDIFRGVADGDTGVRFNIRANGDMLWGDGTDFTLDTTLKRTASNTLTANAKFSASTETSTTFTAASGFDLLEADLRKTCGICTVSVKLNVQSDISPGSGFSNIIDQAIGTLPAGFRPFDIFIAIWGTGIESGDCSIAPNGVVTLRSSDTDQTINAGADIHFSATYVL